MSDIQWGIGIEHEVITLEKDDNYIEGSIIKDNLSLIDNDYGSNQDILSRLDSNCKYKVYTPYYLNKKEI